jgi:hypothetical protein
MEWIDLVQNRDMWRALLSVVMNLRVPQNAENRLATQKGLRHGGKLVG